MSQDRNPLLPYFIGFVFLIDLQEHSTPTSRIVRAYCLNFSFDESEGHVLYFFFDDDPQQKFFANRYLLLQY